MCASGLLLLVFHTAVPAVATCVDWTEETPVPPLVSWSGAPFHVTTGGQLESGYLGRSVIRWQGVMFDQDFWVWDVRDPAWPQEILHYAHQGAAGEEAYFGIDAARGDHLVVSIAGPLYVQRLVTALPDGAEDAPLPVVGPIALGEERAFHSDAEFAGNQLVYLDISVPGVVTTLAILPSDCAFTAPFALSDTIVLVGRDDGLLQVIDFTVPSAPVVHGSVPGTVRHWRLRDGDLVIGSTNSSLFAVDVSELEAPQIAWTIPLPGEAAVYHGDFAVFSFYQGPGSITRVYDVSQSVPVAISAPFGDYPVGALVWDGDVLYTGAGEAFDLQDPASPMLLGRAADVYGQVYVQSGELITSRGRYPLHCYDVTATDGLPPVQLALRANPNPFNPTTEVSFSVPHSGFVQLALYDVRGRTVRTLVAEALEGGRHSVRWDGRDERGRALPARVYLARLVSAGKARWCKLALVE